MPLMMSDAEVLAAQNLAEAVQAAELQRREADKQQESKNSPSGYLFKRGSAAKTWKKRWCCIERGVLYYYVSEGERVLNKPALGALVLLGSSVRRPTTLGNKGKYAKTCFRLDLDGKVQPKMVVMGADDEDDEVPDVVDAKGRTKKTKFVFAADSSADWTAWTQAIKYWSTFTRGNAVSMSEDAFAAIREQANAPIAAAAEAAAAAAEAAAAEAEAAAADAWTCSRSPAISTSRSVSRARSQLSNLRAHLSARASSSAWSSGARGRFCDGPTQSST